MKKRIVVLLISVILLLSAVSCRRTSEVKGSDDTGSSGIVHTRSNLLGFIIEKTDDAKVSEAKQAFITVCEEIGQNAKIYEQTDDMSINQLTDEAVADNCDAVLFLAESDISLSISKLETNKISTVSLIKENENSSCSVVLRDCTADIVELLSDGTDYNSVLVYSSDEFDTESLKKQLDADGYSTIIKHFKRTDFAYKDAQAALYSYLKNNTSIKAIYAIGEQNARPAVLAAKQVGGIKVIGCEISNVNKELYDSGLYALAVSPYYEMTSKAVYAMKKLADGEKAETEYCTVHIVTEDKLDKYVAITENAQKWFKR